MLCLPFVIKQGLVMPKGASVTCWQKAWLSRICLPPYCRYLPLHWRAAVHSGWTPFVGYVPPCVTRSIPLRWQPLKQPGEQQPSRSSNLLKAHCLLSCGHVCVLLHSRCPLERSHTRDSVDAALSCCGACALNPNCRVCRVLTVDAVFRWSWAWPVGRNAHVQDTSGARLQCPALECAASTLSSFSCLCLTCDVPCSCLLPVIACLPAGLTSG